jgi:hypothetical protein|tara:strand:+ start:986 stop:1132 length:147 start_codon:yes stop_codon:yes gene_type:complete
MALILRASALVSLIGLLDALPVCPMALLVFIDILSRREATLEGSGVAD